jgi:hypothetical protein
MQAPEIKGGVCLDHQHAGVLIQVEERTWSSVDQYPYVVVAELFSLR